VVRAYHAAVPGSAVADLSSLRVVVPVRGTGVGKSRLGEALDPEERQALVVGMLLHTLSVLADWPAARATHVVSGDPLIRRLVRWSSSRARAIRESTPPNAITASLNDALIAGRDQAVRSHATAVLYLPADLPLLSATALDSLLYAADAALAAGSGRPIVVVAAADARTGTNALLVAPPLTIDPHFGEASLEGHMRAAAAAEASVLLVNDPALSFDLDTPDDLERLDAGRLVELQALGQSALDELQGRTPASEVA
jgi:2-phospho-L-lactate guanylyltransferase